MSMFRRSFSNLRLSRADSIATTANPPPGYYESSQDQRIDEVDFDPQELRSSTPEDRQSHHTTSSETQSTEPAPPAPPPPPVVLTWAPDLPAEQTANPPNVHVDLPVTVTYTFSPIGSSSMVLVPPSTAINRDTRPLYHISWREDYWLAGNNITTIRRGGSENGQFVAEFNLKGDQKGASVRMGTYEEQWIGEVFKPRNGNHQKWRYNDHTPALYWDKRIHVKSCSLTANNGEIIARFAPPNYNVRNIGTQVSKLEVRPAGQDQVLCDHILVSALILERLRVLRDTNSR
ncbi:hypothetical protein EIP91_009660 [Steccherinum ochraceum]|uniref:DUF6593 domain-containing protein n=1 Tax=Steccherinum ochraceum TaxID=92696 RepID=A0A4R0R417_9APHY|nr:hypothetical protein EIP91_009660 [Steccherinum ochraceum]